VRTRLLAADASGHRRVADYAGLGSLRRWVRTAAVRLALNQGRGVQELATADDDLAARLPDGGDAELSFLKARYRPAFAAALREGLDALAAGDQNLLRQRYVDGLSLEELGALHGVHRATALRRLERARQALLDDVRARLRSRLNLDSGEMESLLRLVASRIEVTLRPGR
jgi:RNA polymerase sigma-70 factor, ECF subfamily